MRRGLLILAACCFTGGCFASFPLDPLEIEEVRNLKKDPGHAHDLSLGVCCRRGRPGEERPIRLEDGRWSVPFPADGLRSEVAGDLKRLGLLREVVEIEGDGTPDELVKRARSAGADLLLSIEPRKKVVTYVGHNAWFIPNIILWAVVLVPSWFVPDETYRTDVEMEAILLDTARKRVILRKPVHGSQEARLNDFQRGWHAWCIFGGPVYDTNYIEAGDTLGPLAMTRAKADLYMMLAETLDRRKAAPNGTTKPVPEVKEPVKPAAIVVGVDRPAGLEKASRFCSADARRVASLLKESLGLGDGDVSELIGGQATAAALRERLKGLKGEGRKSVIFFFAGFGARKGGKACILPVDGDPDGPAESVVSLAEISGALDAAGIPERILFFDAGFSGEGPRSVDGKPAPLREEDVFAGSGREGGFCAFIAGGLDGAVLEGAEFGGGIFTVSLIRALTGEADADGDSRIASSELIDFLARKVNSKAMCAASEQVPKMLGDGTVSIPCAVGSKLK